MQRLQDHNAQVYKTTHYTKEQVRHLKESANKQEKYIGPKFFHAYPKGLTPSQVHPGDEHWPLTSTRRAISSLSSDKDAEGNPKPQILVKTDQTRPGPYGKPEHLWRWKTPEAWTQEPKQMDAFGESQPKSRAYQENLS